MLKQWLLNCKHQNLLGNNANYYTLQLFHALCIYEPCSFFPLEMYKTIIGFSLFFRFGKQCIINNGFVFFCDMQSYHNVEVRVDLAFGLADNPYLNNDSFAHHKKMNPIICRTIASCAQHILHLHAFATCQETARLHEDAIPTILSGNKGTKGPLLDRNTYPW